MSIDLSGEVLDALTVSEKVRLLEQVWQSLCSHMADVSSPELHAEVLRERSERLTDDRSTRIPWAEAKAQLQQLGG